MPDQMHVARLSVQPGWRATLGAHAHAVAEVMVLLTGRLAIHTATRQLHADAGDGVYYPPGMIHEEQALQPSDFICFFLPPGQQLTAPPVVKDPTRRLLTLAHWLVQERTSSHALRDRLIAGYAQAICLELKKCSSLPAASPIDEVRAYLLARLRENHSLDRLASRARMSKFHFLRLYHKHTGLTPMRDLLRMRLEAAYDLLLGTDLPLKQIADQTGFCDPYHFSRMFHAHYGKPPGTLRRKNHHNLV